LSPRKRARARARARKNALNGPVPERTGARGRPGGDPERPRKKRARARARLRDLAYVGTDRRARFNTRRFRVCAAPRIANSRPIAHFRARIRACAAELSTNGGRTARGPSRSARAQGRPAALAARLDAFGRKLETIGLGIATRADDSVVGAERCFGSAWTPPTSEREQRERAHDEYEPGGFRRADPHFF